MNHLFVPYEESLSFKKIGFNEECFTCYNPNKILMKWYEEAEPLKNSEYTSKTNKDFVCAPLYSQVFDWFREKHGITCVIMDFIDDEIGVEWDYSIHKIGTDIDKNGNWTPLIDYSIDDPERKFKTYKDAKLACLQKLITLVKNDNTTRS